MTGAAAVLLALTLVVAVADWIAVGLRNKPLEYVAKPATMVVLIAATVALDPVDPTARAWFVAALAFGLLGDVFLMLPNQEKLFVGGLGSFLVGHLCYVIGMLVAGVSSGGLLVGFVLVVVSLATLGRHIVRGVQAGHPELVVPVMAYVGVISAMVVAAFGRVSAPAIIGALLFYASDALIAFNRFLDSRPWMPMAIIVTYHLGQVGLVLSLI